MAGTAEKQTTELIVSRTAARTVLKLAGVAGLCDNFAGNLTKMFSVRDSGDAGIKVNMNDDGLVIDIFVIIKFGVKIPQMAWDIQNAVKSSVRDITGMKVKAVNVHVQGVSE